jgi:hypothetical protein
VAETTPTRNQLPLDRATRTISWPAHRRGSLNRIGGTREAERSTASVSAYNYETFDGYVASGAEQREFGAWPSLLHAGEPAPEIAGVLLDGDQIALSSVWKRRTVVVEFGSFT